MSPRRSIFEVARREFVERWRSRTVRVSFAIVLLLVVGAAVFMTLADKGKPTDDFGLVSGRGDTLAPVLRATDRADGRIAHIHVLRNDAVAKRAVRDGDVDVAIVGGRLIVKESRSGGAVRAAQRAIAAQASLTRLQAAGLTQQEAVGALTPAPVKVDVLEPGARDTQRDKDVLFVGMLLLFVSLVLYGQLVASSVAEEKSSRVIELLLTSVAPRRLLAGKVVGVGVLGIAQFAVVCGAGVAAAIIAGGEGLAPSAPGTIALVAVWFVLGFAFYSVAYAALGALVSRQEDLEATTAPVNLLIIGAYWGAMAAISDPNGTWAQIAAFVPPLSPFVVPTRVIVGDMGAAGLAAAIVVELLATFILVKVAAGIYERVVMRVGAPISLRAALRPEGTPAHRAAGWLRPHAR